MVRQPALGNKVQDGKGINESFVRLICVYAGSSWTLQQPNSRTCGRIKANKKNL